MKKLAYLATLLLVFLLSCEKSNNDLKQENLSLEEAVDKAAVDINLAVEAIEQSKAYGLFNRELKTKGLSDDDPPALSIQLEDLKGYYVYAPNEENESETFKQHKAHCNSYFKRIDDSEWFIINLPYQKAINPSALLSHNAQEEYENNMLITTSAYAYERDNSMKWSNYTIASQFDVDDEYAGSLWVNATVEDYFKSKTHSKFGFTDEHFMVVETQLSDTILLRYALEDADEATLFSEKVVLVVDVKAEMPHLHFAYELTMGDIKIVNAFNENNQLEYFVYKADELQEEAIVEIIQSGEGVPNADLLFMHQNKDLKITFDDGSSVLLSELLGDSQAVLSELFNSMKELYLSQMLINKLAWQIYKEQICDAEGSE